MEAGYQRTAVQFLRLFFVFNTQFILLMLRSRSIIHERSTYELWLRCRTQDGYRNNNNNDKMIIQTFVCRDSNTQYPSE